MVCHRLQCSAVLFGINRVAGCLPATHLSPRQWCPSLWHHMMSLKTASSPWLMIYWTDPYLITTNHSFQTVISLYCATLQETETGHYFYWSVVAAGGIHLALTVQYCDLSTTIRCTILCVKTRPGAIYSMFTGLSISVSSLVPAGLTSVTEVFSCLCQMQMWSTIWQTCCLDIISLSYTSCRYQLLIIPPTHTHMHVRAAYNSWTSKQDQSSSGSPCWTAAAVLILCTCHRSLDWTLELSKSYFYWTVHHLTSWINWTNLMSLYESFLLLNMFRMLLMLMLALLQPALGYHPTPAEPHQYTSTHRNRTVHPHTVVSSWEWM